MVVKQVAERLASQNEAKEDGDAEGVADRFILPPRPSLPILPPLDFLTLPFFLEFVGWADVDGWGEFFFILRPRPGEPFDGKSRSDGAPGKISSRGFFPRACVLVKSKKMLATIKRLERTLVNESMLIMVDLEFVRSVNVCDVCLQLCVLWDGEKRREEARRGEKRVKL